MVNLDYVTDASVEGDVYRQHYPVVRRYYLVYFFAFPTFFFSIFSFYGFLHDYFYSYTAIW